MLNVGFPEAAAFAAAASEGGTPAWVTPVIAAGAAIAAALVTALSAAYVARRKVAELELTNSFDLSKQYLESARNYTQTVYLPLSVDVYQLHDSFLTYKAYGKPVERSAPSGPPSIRERFEDDCRLFIGETRTRFYQGAGAVLTIRLDKDITSFISFLQESLDIEEVVQKKSLDFGIAVRIVSRVALTAASIIVPAIGVAAGVSTGTLISFGSEKPAEQKVIAAPIMSDVFEEQFDVFIAAIKLGIKQVTLGGFKE
jgi:hypothetical protein